MSMNTQQSKLVKLAEECAEVAQAALKQVHYGKHMVNPSDSNPGRFSNMHLLREEILDVLVVVGILEHLGEIHPITDEDVQAHFRSKLPKIDKYTKVSHELGLLATPWVPDFIP